MKKVFYVLGFAAIIFTSCKDSFKKTTGGIQYKIISDGKGAKIKDGDFMEIRLLQEYKDAAMDTILLDPKNGNQIFPLSSQIPAPYYGVFSHLRNGDSVIMKALTDTLIKAGHSLPFMKKDQYVVLSFRVMNVYTNKDQADSAYQANMKVAKAKRYQQTLEQLKKTLATTEAEQLKTDDKILTDYMAKNHITATKTELGAYVSLTNPGTGDNLGNNVIAVVNYTGKTLEDSVFDSNIDPKFSHPEPLEVDMSEFRVIPGWIDGLKSMKKGSKGLLLIPSSLAYGKQGSGPKIKPNTNLVFEMEVVDVKTAEQVQAERKAKQEQMMEQRKHMMDSMQNAKKKDSALKK